MHCSPRWRLLWLVVLCAVCAVLTVGGGSASALSLDSSTDSPITIDGDVHWFGSPTPLTSGNYQWTDYWDAPDATTGAIYLKLSRRDLTTGTVQTIRFDGSSFADQHLDVFNDGHNYPTLGLDANDGTVHLSFSNHALPHHFGQSSTGCMTQTDITRSCTFTWSDHQANRATEAVLTYPHYFNDREGHLFMGYRSGTTNNGDLYLNTYNDTTHTWAEVNGDGMVAWGGSGSGSYDPDGAGPVPNATQRSTYIIGWAFDKNDRLNLVWTWREYQPSYPGGSRIHGLYYMYSDNHGVDWKDNAGRAIATTGSDPALVTDTSTEAISIPEGTYLGLTNMVLDSNNQPHFIGPVSDVVTYDSLSTNMRQSHWWRTTDGSWHQQYVESTGTQTPTLGNMFLDRSDNIYYIYAKQVFDWSPWNASVYGQTDLPADRVTWQDDGTDKYLNIVPFSATTLIQSNANVNTPISISSGARNYRIIEVRMKNQTPGTSFRVDWTTDRSQSGDAAKSQTFTGVTANDTTFKTYRFTVTDADWRDTLRTLSIYPAGDGYVHGTGTNNIKIDYIKIEDDQSTPNVGKSWDFNTIGMTIYDAESGAGDNWGSFTIGALLPTVNDTLNDGYWTVDNQLYRDSRKVEFDATQQGAPGTESLVEHSMTIDGDDLYKDWGFGYDAMGWTAQNNVTSFAAGTDGSVHEIGGTLSGSDSQIVSATNLSEPLTWNGTLGTKVVVRLKNTSAARLARLSFITDADQTWDSAKSLQVAITANSS